MSISKLILVATVASIPLASFSAPVFAAAAHNLQNGTNTTNTNEAGANPGMAAPKPMMKKHMMKKHMKKM